jgi:hypothetical protein
VTAFIRQPHSLYLNHLKPTSASQSLRRSQRLMRFSSVSPSTNSEGIATGSGCGTRQSAIISGAVQYYLYVAKCGENDHRKYERGQPLSPLAKTTSMRRATMRGMRRLRNKQALNKIRTGLILTPNRVRTSRGRNRPAFQNGKCKVIDDLNGDSLLCPKLF